MPTPRRSRAASAAGPRVASSPPDASSSPAGNLSPAGNPSPSDAPLLVEPGAGEPPPARNPSPAEPSAGEPSAAGEQSPARNPSPVVRPEAVPGRPWVILPTYNEADNVAAIAAAILEAVPAAPLLIVDDGSPDGTGDLADDLAAADARVRVLHRARKAGLGRAYLAGFRAALDSGATAVAQIDADWSHDPADLPRLFGAIAEGADLVIGSRYARGGSVIGWGLARTVISRGGSLFARTVLELPVHDLTAGFKAWRASTLVGIEFAGVHAGGYVFQIEMTYRAQRRGARVLEVPVTFQDRRVGQSKMSRRIVAEALLVVVRLRLDELRGHGPRRGA